MPFPSRGLFWLIFMECSACNSIVMIIRNGIPEQRQNAASTTKLSNHLARTTHKKPFPAIYPARGIVPYAQSKWNIYQVQDIIGISNILLKQADHAQRPAAANQVYLISLRSFAMRLNSALLISPLAYLRRSIRIA